MVKEDKFTNNKRTRRKEMRNTRLTIRILMVLAAMLLIPATAFAVGTTANTTVSNNAVLEFSVGGATQPTLTNSVDFLVDTKVNFTVTTLLSATTSPLLNNVVLSFFVNNAGNSTHGFMLETFQDAGVFDMTDIRLYIDGGGVANAVDGGDTLYTPGNAAFDLAADAGQRVLIVANTPGGLTDGWTDIIYLIANATQSGNTTLLVNTPGANAILGLDTVLADGAGGVVPGGAADVAFNNIYSSSGTYTVASAIVSFSKIVNSVVWDPINYNNGNQKAIPGAYVRYDVTIENDATATGSAVIANVVDSLPNTVALIPYYDDMSTPATPASSYGGAEILVDCVGGDRACDAGTVGHTDGGGAVTYTAGAPSTLLIDLTGILTGGALNVGELAPGDSATIRYMVEIQ